MSQHSTEDERAETPDVDDEKLYGLPELRDPDGKLLPVDHTFLWNGTEVTIKIRPPTVAELQAYEDLGEETSEENLGDIVERHLVEPDVSYEDMSGRELNCYLEGIMSHGMNQGSIGQAVQDEIDGRQEGNRS